MKNEKEEIVIEEFKTSTKRTVESGKRKGDFIILTVFCLVFLAAILAGTFFMEVPVVWACVILVLESLIGVCLHDTPVWVHGIEMIISIVFGAIFHQMAFMLIGVVIYIATILALHFMDQQKGQV